jgi:hypothetical protein
MIELQVKMRRMRRLWDCMKWWAARCLLEHALSPKETRWCKRFTLISLKEPMKATQCTGQCGKLTVVSRIRTQKV